MVDNTGGHPWALEQTLERLLSEAIVQNQFLKHDATRAHDFEKKGQKSDGKNAKDNQKALGLLHKASTRTTATMSRLMKSFIVGQTATGKVFKEEMQRIVEGFESMSVKGSESGNPMMKMLGRFGMGLGVATTALTALTHKIGEAGEQYFELYNKGHSLSGSLADLWTNSGRAGMSLSDYSNALSEHSEVIKSMTTANMRGEDIFMRMATNIRDTTYKMGNFGLSMGEINDYLGDYLATQRLSGHLENMSSINQQNAVKNYIVQITELSAITGKHRKQIMDDAQAAMRVPSLSSLLSTLGPDAAAAMQQGLAQVTALDESGELQKALIEMVQMNGTLVNKEQIIALQSTGMYDELRTLALSIRAGKDVTNENTRMASAFSDAISVGAKHAQNYSLATAAGVGHFEVFNTLMEQSAKYNASGAAGNKSLFDSATQLYAIFDKLVDDALGPFNVLLGDMISSFSKALDKFKVVDKIQVLFKGFGDFLSKTIGTGNAMETAALGLVGMFDWLITGLKSVIIYFDGMGMTFMEAIKDIFTKVGSWLGDAIMTGVAEGIKSWLLGPKTAAGRDFEARLARGAELNAARLAGGNLEEHARGGIATQRSIFGEAGPEAAIPLDTGQRIPIAEIKGDFNKAEMNEMIRLLKDMIQRQEVTAEQGVKTVRSLDNLGSNIRRSGSAVF